MLGASEDVSISMYFSGSLFSLDNFVTVSVSYIGMAFGSPPPISYDLSIALIPESLYESVLLS